MIGLLPGKGAPPFGGNSPDFALLLLIDVISGDNNNCPPKKIVLPADAKMATLNMLRDKLGNSQIAAIPIQVAGMM